MITHQTILALDVGEKRIGLAKADTDTKFPFALTWINMDEHVFENVYKQMEEHGANKLVVGFPRNQSGEATQQSAYVLDFVERLRSQGLEIVLQDESLTSVHAENYLRSLGKPYEKGDIDAHAAAIILGDYLEERYGH